MKLKLKLKNSDLGDFESLLCEIAGHFQNWLASLHGKDSDLGDVESLLCRWFDLTRQAPPMAGE